MRLQSYANVLKQRIITAVILVLIVLSALLAKNPIYWSILIYTAIGLGFWEWLRFCEVSSPPRQLLYGLVFAALAYAAHRQFLPISVLVTSACILWCLLFVFTTTDKLDAMHQACRWW